MLQIIIFIHGRLQLIVLPVEFRANYLTRKCISRFSQLFHDYFRVKYIFYTAMRDFLTFELIKFYSRSVIFACMYVHINIVIFKTGVILFMECVLPVAHMSRHESACIHKHKIFTFHTNRGKYVDLIVSRSCISKRVINHIGDKEKIARLYVYVHLSEFAPSLF